MSTETEQLVVQLEARIDQFEKSFRKASQTANDNWSSIENRGRQAGARLRADMGKTTSGIANSFRGLSATFAGSVGLTGAASATGLLAVAIKINSELAKVSSLAKEAQLSTDRLQQVKFAANMGGVTDETFPGDIRTSLGLLDEAQRQVNSLQRLFNANGLSIKQANGELVTFDQLLSNAAKLMAGVSKDAQRAKIAQMLGLSREWIGALKDGPEAFERMAKEAVNAGAVIDADTIRKAKEFDDAWARALVRFKAGFTETLTDLGSAFADFWSDIADSAPGVSFINSILDKWAGGLSRLTLPELEEALQRSIEQGVGKVEIDRIQAEIDKRLGETPLKITVHANPSAAPTVVPKDGGEKSDFERAIAASNKRIAALNAETATIGLNSEARERAKLVAELEEAAKKANTAAGFQNAEVTDTQRQKIEQLAGAMEAAARNQRVAQEAFAGFNDMLQFGGNIAVDFVDKLSDKTAKLSDLAISALDTIKKAAIQAAFAWYGATRWDFRNS
jgi:membrane protease subunit (stomatin/prohibitin family)